LILSGNQNTFLFFVLNIEIFFQLTDSSLVVTTENELNARKEALKSIIERKIELQLNLSDNEFHNDQQDGDTLSPEQTDEIKNELAILEALEKEHQEKVEKAIERIQTTLDTHAHDLKEIKQGLVSQNVTLCSLTEVCIDLHTVL